MQTVDIYGVMSLVISVSILYIRMVQVKGPQIFRSYVLSVGTLGMVNC